MLKNVDQCCPKPSVMFSNVLFCPEPEDIQFAVIEEHTNQRIFTFEKLESEDLDIEITENYEFMINTVSN